jgi:hypothetical protein
MDVVVIQFFLAVMLGFRVAHRFYGGLFIFRFWF